tara:strand:+ start:438 stop:1034 length:597 start_codon:yes stop_codon:yes gene_type:complete
MILLIDNYDSFTFNLYQYLVQEGLRVKVFRNDKISIDKINKLKPSAIVLSPGPGQPKEAGIGLKLVESFYKEVPILGICLGHQIIAEFFGGKIIRSPKIMHGKISPIFHKGEGLYKGLPRSFNVVRYHSLIVDEKAFPHSLKATCFTEDGVIMGLKHERYPIEGIQFHPESHKTDFGKQLILNFLNRTSIKEKRKMVK